MSAESQNVYDDDWLSDDINEWHSKDCDCWECSIDYKGGCWDYEVDNVTDSYNTFIQIENNYFLAWADRKISPTEALVKFFKCIELCEGYNLKYSSNPSIKDTNHELKLLKYHYNSLKYSVQTQYILNKYTSCNSYSLLIYGYIRHILDDEFQDEDDILMPLCLVNMIAVFHNELLTNYTKLLHLTTVIESACCKTSDIEYVTLNDSKSSALILTDTISFILDYVEAHQHTKDNSSNDNSWTQLLWNTVLFLQMKRNVLWFKYALILCNAYMQTQQYQESKDVLQYMEDHKWIQRISNGYMLDKVLASKYYSYKIQHVLMDIASKHDVINAQIKVKLMRIYHDSCAFFDSLHGEHKFECYQVFYHYFKLFLLLNDYERACVYLQRACYLYYNESMYKMYDENTDKCLLEYNLLLYLLMNGTNEWDSTLFDNLLHEGRIQLRHHYRGFYGTKQYLLLNIFDLCHRFPSYAILITNLFGDENENCVSQLLSLNECRQTIDEFIFKISIDIIPNKRKN